MIIIRTFLQSGRYVFLTALIMMTTSGCNNSSVPTFKHKTAFAALSLEEGTLYLCKIDHLTSVAIWFNTKQKIHDKAGMSKPGTTHVFSEKISLLDGSTTDWQCQISDEDGKTGKLTIGEESYDLANGSLFLVLETKKDLNIVQVNYPVSSIKDGGVGLDDVKKDPEVKKWLRLSKQH